MSAHDLKAKLDAARTPGIAKAKADAKLSSKLRAAKAFKVALESLRWSKRHAAHFFDVDDKVIREWLDAGQQPAWIPLALPRAAYLEYLNALLEDAPLEGLTGTYDV